MSQLALDLLSSFPPTFENFVPGPNTDTVATLRRIVEMPDRPPGERQWHLWGPSGSGRSHLLRAMGYRLGATARLLEPDSPLAAFGFDASARGWLVDDCEQLDPDRQQALFDLVNQVRDRPGVLIVTAADASPRGLTLREDVRTRLGWGGTHALRPLTDEDKALALATLAAQRGVAMSEEVPRWLLAHTSRDMRALIALFDELDRHALARQRAITLPLLRDYLQRAL